MTNRHRVLSASIVVAMVFALFPYAPARASMAITGGDLIRGTSFSAVYYYGEDGFRYVFPNEKTYFTWYENFDDVTVLTDAELASIQIGGNVTYKPGVKMIKINSDPKTYAVANGGTLRWVSSEAIAIDLYGSAWNTQIDDVPDAYFTNYTIGEPIGENDMYDAAMERDATATISADKSLSNMTLMNIVNMRYANPDDDSTVVTISDGQTIAFANLDDVNHTFTADDNSWGTGTIEPWHHFIRRFDTPGTYTFHCSYHPEMTGTVIVE